MDFEAENERDGRRLEAWESFEAGALVEACAQLEQLVREYPEYADAHADLAEIEGARGQHERRLARLLLVRELDVEQELHAGFTVGEFEQLIVDTARRTVQRLPAEFRDKLEGVPILLEARPSLELVREGFDPRALGLCEGLDHAGHDAGEVTMSASRIVLYAANLIALSEDEEMLAHEVEITVLHEVGHYFGLDEDDMLRLGLD